MSTALVFPLTCARSWYLPSVILKLVDEIVAASSLKI